MDTVAPELRIVHCPKTAKERALDQHIAEMTVHVQRTVGGTVSFEEDNSGQRNIWRVFVGPSFDKSEHRAEWGTKAGALRRLRNSRGAESTPPREPRTSERYGPTHSSASVLDALANRARHAKVPWWKTAARAMGFVLAGLVVLAAVVVLTLYSATRRNPAAAPVVRVVAPEPAIADAPDAEAPPVVTVPRRLRARRSERATETGVER